MAACSQNNEPQHIGQAISEYSNPIDEYFLPKFESAFPEVARRELQDTYRGVWEAEFENVIAWLKSKCYYQEDMDKMTQYAINVKNMVAAARVAVTMDWLDMYGISPDAPSKNTHPYGFFEYGNGTRSGLNQIAGEIYRNAAMLLIDHCEGYAFRDVDYSQEYKELIESVAENQIVIPRQMTLSEMVYPEWICLSENIWADYRIYSPIDHDYNIVRQKADFIDSFAGEFAEIWRHEMDFQYDK